MVSSRTWNLRFELKKYFLCGNGHDISLNRRIEAGATSPKVDASAENNPSFLLTPLKNITLMKFGSLVFDQGLCNILRFVSVLENKLRHGLGMAVEYLLNDIYMAVIDVFIHDRPYCNQVSGFAGWSDGFEFRINNLNSNEVSLLRTIRCDNFSP